MFNVSCYMKIIDGRALAEKIKDEIVREICAMNKVSKPDKHMPRLPERRPNLAIILIGEREDSQLYVNLKEKEAKKIGIDTHVYRCDADIPERQIFDTIDYLNKDDLIDAILVQLPLPAGFDTDGIMAAIDPAKDVDRFHPYNLETLFETCSHAHVMPPVFSAALEMLASIGCEPKDKTVCIIANSDIFGKGLAKVLSCLGAKTETAHAGDKNLTDKTRRADILITAVGKPKFIKKNMIKKDAIVIDIGITKNGKKVLGDADLKNLKDKAGYITPVPGGVGPLTIAMLFRNTLELYKRRREARNM